MNNFILELIKRWGASQPWFFKVVMWIGVATSAIIGLPAFLENTEIWELLPNAFQAIVSQAVFYAGLVAAFVAKLAATSEEKKNRKIED